MPWLRVDDGMPEHRKVLGLKRADRWAWMELLCYVARQGNGGHVPPGIVDVYRYVTPAFLRRCVELELLDVDDDGGLEVHDWDVYNPKVDDEIPLEDRVRDAVERMPGASANEIARMLGGRRKAVLATVKRFREVPDGSETVPANGSGNLSGTGSHARASRTPTPLEPLQQHTSTADAAAAERLAHAGWTQGQIHRAADELDRAIAWIDHAEHDPTCTTPGALAWSGFQTGSLPVAQRSSIAAGAVGTRSSSPPLPERTTEPDPAPAPPPAAFRKLAGTPAPRLEAAG